jgi:hypothetical protein
MKNTLLSIIALSLLSANTMCLSAQNVMISNANTANEPAILINPSSPANIVAGSNTANVYRSSDTGRTWKSEVVTSPYGVWGDPSFCADTAGDLYFFHLSNPRVGSWIDRIVCQKSTDQGVTWSSGTFTGKNGVKEQDKEWIVVDTRNNNIYVTWTQFDSYNSTTPGDSTIILFSKSVDAGESWSAPLRISKIAGTCLDGDNAVEGAVPAVGPNGEIYVSWAGANGLVFNTSSDEGVTWLTQETPIDPMPTGWDYDIPGLMRANGLPITLCDLSDGPNRGTIYVNWSDQRNGPDNTDVFMTRSTDGGVTWAPTSKINSDNTDKHQFLTWMTIDQVSGYLYCVFYDRSAYDSDSTDVVLAVSKDGGESFENIKISESPFVPFNTVFFGDYNNISAHNGVIRPIWTRLQNGNLSVWTHLINQDQLDNVVGVEEAELPAKFEFENYPNPSYDYQYISFKLRKASTINLTLLSSSGKVIATLIRDEQRGYGKYIERLDLENYNLAAGSYSIMLEIDGQVVIKRVVKL